MTPRPSLEIETRGRGGGMTYVEGPHRHALSWEFAMDPAIASIFGTRAESWDREHPWAAGRQAAIYRFIADEVVRRQVPGGSHEIDLDAGQITILSAPRRRTAESEERSYFPLPSSDAPRPRAPERSGAWERFVASIVACETRGDPALGYDLAAIDEMGDAERADAVSLLARRGAGGWREIAAYDAIGTREAIVMLREGMRHHRSVATRIAAAQTLHRRGECPDLVSFLCEQLHALHDPRDGLREALELAARLDAPEVRQALLWASRNGTDCAPACARLLLQLTGAPVADDDPDDVRLLEELGRQNSSVTRDRAFARLVERSGLAWET